jgi:hypothetical protein
MPNWRIERPRSLRYSLAIISAMHLLMNGMTQWLARFSAAGAGVRVLGISRAHRSLFDQVFDDA